MRGYPERIRHALEGDGEEQLPYDPDSANDDLSLREGVALLESTRDALSDEQGVALDPIAVSLLSMISNRVAELTGCRIAMEQIATPSVALTARARVEVDKTLAAAWTALTAHKASRTLSTESEAQDISIADAITRIGRAVKLDGEYRWSWWCNLVMAGIDSGASREVAEAAAERFMGTLFDVKMATDPQRMRDRVDRYVALMADYLPEDAMDRIRATVVESEIRAPEHSN